MPWLECKQEKLNNSSKLSEYYNYSKMRLTKCSTLAIYDSTKVWREIPSVFPDIFPGTKATIMESTSQKLSLSSFHGSHIKVPMAFFFGTRFFSLPTWSDFSST